MRFFCRLMFLSVLLAVSAARAQDTPGTIARDVGIVQNLGAQLPLDVPLRDESGKTVVVGDYLGERPALLTFVYYRCPMLCSKELESLTRSLRVLSLKIGEDFDILTISISPTETPELAAAKKRSYMKALDRPGAERGWHFLTGDEDSIAKLTEVAGFRYKLNETTGLYAHDAGLIVLTPSGKISKYLPGLDYPAKSLQAILKVSKQGVIGRAATWVKLLCYDYDPSTGRYTMAIMRTVRVGGVATVLILAGSVLVMNRRARSRARAENLAAA